MSLKGTVPPPTVRPSVCATELANAVQAAPKTAGREGLIPDGRKKLTSGAGTNAPSGPTPQPVTCSGNWVARAPPPATAFSQFDTSNSEFTIFMLIGRFR